MNNRNPMSQETAIESCILHPASSDNSADYLRIPFDAPSDVSQLECYAAWAWLLHLYTGQDADCFAVRNRKIAACRRIDGVLKVHDLLNSIWIEGMEDVSCCNTAVIFGIGTTEMELHKYDVSVHIRSLDSWLQTRNSHFYSHMAPTYAHLLDLVRQSRDASIDFRAAPLLSKDGRRVIAALASIPQKVPEASLLHSLVPSTGNTIALQSDTRSITYAQLGYLTDCLASYLQSKGLEEGRVAATLFSRSHLPVICHIAIIKAGGTVTSLDPSHPTIRHHEVLRQISSPLVLVEPELVEPFRVCYSDNLLEISEDLLDRLSSTCANPNFQPSTPDITSPAWITTTSGSTGAPKLISLTHAALTIAFQSHLKALRLDSSSRLLHFCSPSFDVSIAEVFITLSAGATLVIPTDHDRINFLGDVIQQKTVTHAVLTPSVARLLDPADLRGLETLVLTGECMGSRDVEMWAHHVRLVNLYGPAECSVWASGRVVEPLIGENPKNVGRGLWGGLEIVEIGSRRLVPVGALGELVIKGPGVANYLGSVQGGFVDNWNGERAFRTGDLAKWTDDGDVIVLGRFGSVVKVRGQRLDVGEVEGAIIKAGAMNATVLVPTAGPYEGRLVVVIETGHQKCGSQLVVDTQLEIVDTMQNLRHHLERQLPSYMIPVIWIPVVSIPLTASGKLDRKQTANWISYNISNSLYKKILQLNVGKQSLTPLNSDLGDPDVIREIWAVALGITAEEVGNTSFLRLGGDSITAMQIVSRCRAEGIQISVSDVIAAKDTTNLLARSQRCGVAMISVAARDHPEDTLFQLSPIQSLWFDIAPTGPSNYTQSFLFEVLNPASHNTITSAFEKLIDRHPMLRARFQATPPGWKQFVSTDHAGSLRIHNYNNISSINGIFTITQHTQETAIDIERGPVFAVDTFRLTQTNSQIIFIAAHHLIIDLVSWRILLSDLADYLKTGNFASAGPSPPHFSNWLEQQQQQPFQRLLQQPTLYGESRSYMTTLSFSSTTAILEHSHNLGALAIILSGLFHSHKIAFQTSPPPTIYNESHGRSATASFIDPSSTIGWFTTIAAVSPNFNTNDADSSDFLTTLAAVCACKLVATRSEPMNASMEILFNFRGSVQPLPKAFGLVEEAPIQPTEEGAEIVPRLAAIDVEGVVTRDGRLELVWTYPAVREREIIEWAEECVRVLEDVGGSEKGAVMRVLEGTGGSEFDEFMEELGFEKNSVEEIFEVKCETQLRILQAQHHYRDTSSGMYQPVQSWTLEPPPKLDDLARVGRILMSAHSILRTTFHFSPTAGWVGITHTSTSTIAVSLTASLLTLKNSILSLRLSHAQIDGFSTDLLFSQLLTLLSDPSQYISPSPHHYHLFLAPHSSPPSSLTTTKPCGKWSHIPLPLPPLATLLSAAQTRGQTLAQLIRAEWCRAVGPDVDVEYFLSTRTSESSSIIGPLLEIRSCHLNSYGVLVDINSTAEVTLERGRRKTLVNFRRKLDGEEGSRMRRVGRFEVTEEWCYDPMPFWAVMEVIQEGKKRVRAKVGFWDGWVESREVERLVGKVVGELKVEDEA